MPIGETSFIDVFIMGMGMYGLFSYIMLEVACSKLKRECTVPVIVNSLNIALVLSAILATFVLAQFTCKWTMIECTNSTLFTDDKLLLILGCVSLIIAILSGLVGGSLKEYNICAGTVEADTQNKIEASTENDKSNANKVSVFSWSVCAFSIVMSIACFSTYYYYMYVITPSGKL